ncbi:SipW-dependent-type signal peptide-containing protein [Brevibacterium aurantiacum]|uniref:SipW-dependent-type signal peptide-containing protein n=1 Tax=Brevibacterium aurantiacum TaxID=273384 RepID=UPI0016432D48|nr:SipW-dependent-type signal peptide-containing protein [Brevibacterium aurantiacum]
MRFTLGPLRDPNPSERVSSGPRSDSRRQNRAHAPNGRALRNRRIKAVLAGGLVFGIGATATLAAWTDTETASGSFEAGRFKIDLSVDKTWSSSREMTFKATGMYPGSTVYAPAYVRTTADTTMKGQIQVAGNGVAGSSSTIAGNLEYRAVTKSFPSAAEAFASACDASAFAGSPSYVFGGGASKQPLRTSATSTSKQTVNSVAGSVQAYCFEVVLPISTPSAAQGTSAAHTWTFDAESVPAGS